MSADGAVRTARDLFGPRFFITSLLPAFAGAAFLLVLAWARTPDGPRFGQAWRVAAGVTAGQVVLGLLVITVLALVLQPLNLSVVRLLEGYWPRWAAPARWLGRLGQSRRRERMRRRATVPADDENDEAVQRAGQAGAALRAAFAAHVLMPTRLGNALAAAESRAGKEYGLDAVVVWPRLYLVLDDTTRAVVDDRRTTLDALCRFSVTMAATAVAAVPLLAGGWWPLLALAPLAVSRLAYTGAVHAAIAYGEAVRAAIDLHRFDLLARLHLPLPDDQAAEQAANTTLCTLWRQAPGLVPLTYHHPEEPRGTD